MYITLSVELFSQNQTEAILHLLYFPTLLLSKYTGKIPIATRSAWRYKTTSYTSLDRFLSTRPKDNLNEVRVEYDFPNPCSVEKEVTLSSVYQTLDISPTNAMWSSTKNWPADKVTKHHSSYFNLKGQEEHLEASGVTQRPSYLRSHIGLETDLLPEIIVEKLFDYIEICVADLSICSELFGAGDYTISPVPLSRANTPSIISDLSDWPKAYPLLGQRFDRMHPWMLGNKEYCSGLKEVLPDEVRINYLSSAYSPCDLAALHVPREVAQNDAIYRAASSFFVPKDHSTAKEGWCP